MTSSHDYVILFSDNDNHDQIVMMTFFLNDINHEQLQPWHCHTYWRPCRQYIIEKLEVGKWIFLWVVLGEAISLGLALVMRLMGNLEGKYENMELEEANRLHNMELQGISKSMTAQQKITNKNEDR